MSDKLPDHKKWMKLALAEAEKAAALGDVPVGAIAIHENQVIGRGYNRKEKDGDPLAHAEMIAIKEASKYLDGWRLTGVTLYCTLEPCPMCAGAMVQARLPHLVWATDDPKAGAGGSVMDLLQHRVLNHRVEITRGVMADEARQQLVDFFADLRQK